MLWSPFPARVKGKGDHNINMGARHYKYNYMQFTRVCLRHVFVSSALALCVSMCNVSLYIISELLSALSLLSHRDLELGASANSKMRACVVV